MPSVTKDATPAEGAIRMVMRVPVRLSATEGTAGKATPTQHDAHVEQEWAS